MEESINICNRNVPEILLFRNGDSKDRKFWEHCDPRISNFSEFIVVRKWTISLDFENSQIYVEERILSL